MYDFDLQEKWYKYSDAEDMFARWDEITVHEFDFKAKKQPEPYNVKLKDATIDQGDSCICRCNVS